jgi:hypothetical protein
MIERLKIEVTNIIVEKAIRGEKTPMWIKVLFPQLADEIEPITRMLTGTLEPQPQTTTNQPSLWPRLAATTAAIAIIIAGLWIGLPGHIGENHQSTPALVKPQTTVERALPPTRGAKTLCTATTPTTASTATPQKR